MITYVISNFSDYVQTVTQNVQVKNCSTKHQRSNQDLMYKETQGEQHLVLVNQCHIADETRGGRNPPRRGSHIIDQEQTTSRKPGKDKQKATTNVQINDRSKHTPIDLEHLRSTPNTNTDSMKMDHIVRNRYVYINKETINYMCKASGQKQMLHDIRRFEKSNLKNQ